MVSKDHKLSMRRQCALLTLSRSNLYYEPKGESAENLRFMEIIDKQFLETPWYGSRQMARHMKRNDHQMRAPSCPPFDAPYAVWFRFIRNPTPARSTRSTRSGPTLLRNAGDRPPKPSLVRRYHLYSDAARLPVPRGHHGLAQPQGVGLAAFQQHGRRVLR